MGLGKQLNGLGASNPCHELSKGCCPSQVEADVWRALPLHDKVSQGLLGQESALAAYFISVEVWMRTQASVAQRSSSASNAGVAHHTSIQDPQRWASKANDKGCKRGRAQRNDFLMHNAGERGKASTRKSTGKHGCIQFTFLTARPSTATCPHTPLTCVKVWMMACIRRKE